jgi:ferrous iron transport protein A
MIVRRDASDRIGIRPHRSRVVAISIQSMRPGDSARITGLARGDRAYRQRLLAMGLTPGVVFSLRRTAPLGDPIEIDVRDFPLTLRRSEAAVLELEAAR